MKVIFWTPLIHINKGQLKRHRNYGASWCRVLNLHTADYIQISLSNFWETFRASGTYTSIEYFLNSVWDAPSYFCDAKAQ